MSCNGLYQRVYRAITARISLDELERIYSEFDNNYSRVEYMLKEPRLNGIFHVAPKRTAKDAKRAKAFKDDGNKMFQRKNHAAAIQAYNKAIRLSPLDDNDNILAVCYANRSAVLFHLKLYSACLNDIDRAIYHGYSEEMLYKLVIRKAKCHQFINTDQLEEAVSAAYESLSISNLDETGKSLWSNEISKVSGKLSAQDQKDPSKFNDRPLLAFGDDRNQDFSALSSKVNVAENNEFGRFICASEDMQTGEVVLIEQPYCSVTLPDYYLTHCSHCQKQVECTLIPCQQCADVVYCSDECQLEAWTKYHQFECQHMSNIKDLNVNMGHLACRTALQAGISTLRHLLDQSKITQTPKEEQSGYLRVFTLEGHEDERVPKDLVWRSVAAVLLAKLCNLDDWSDGCNDALAILASFVLHNLQVLPCNAHEISEMSFDKKTPYLSELLEVGAGIYPTLSFFNHSCDPTVVRSFQAGRTCVVKTLCPIESNEQIFDNYGCLYAVSTTKERQVKLQNQYYFSCCCPACLNDWPLYNSLSYDEGYHFKCQGCGSLVVEEICVKCGNKFNQKSTEKVLSVAKAAFDQQLSRLFSEYIKGAELDEALNKLITYSNLANKLVFRPYKSLNDCQEALKHVYNMYGNISFKK